MVLTHFGRCHTQVKFWFFFRIVLVFRLCPKLDRKLSQDMNDIGYFFLALLKWWHQQCCINFFRNSIIETSNLLVNINIHCMSNRIKYKARIAHILRKLQWFDYIFHLILWPEKKEERTGTKLILDFSLWAMMIGKQIKLLQSKQLQNEYLT